MQEEQGKAKTGVTLEEMLKQKLPYTTSSTNITGIYAVADFGVGNTTITKVNKCPFCNCYSFEKDGILYKLEL